MNNLYRIIICQFIVGCCLLSLPVTGEITVSFKTTLLCTLPKDDIHNINLLPSQDMQRIIGIVERDNKRYVVIDGVYYEADVEADKSGIASYPWHIAFSPHGTRVAYSAIYNGKYHVVVDGIKGKAYDSIGRWDKSLSNNAMQKNFTFSADDKHVAYRALLGESAMINIDGIESKAYYDVSYPYFSRDGKHVAYCANGKDGYVTVIDGIESIKYKYIDFFSMRFSADGKHSAYIASRDGYKNLLVIDGIEGKEYEGISKLLFNPDGKRIAFTVVFNPNRQNEKQAVVYDGVEGKPYDRIDNLTFSPDGKHIAYTAHRENNDVAVIDGVEGRLYDQVGVPCFSSDGRHVAYSVYNKTTQKWRYVVDGIEGIEYDGIGTISYSADGNDTVYIAKYGNKMFTVINNVKGKEYDDIYDWRLTLSADGKGIAYYAKLNNTWVVVVNGIEGNVSYTDKYAVDHLCFSPDNKHVAYTSYHNNKYYLNVDGVERNSYSRIIGTIIFDTPRHIHLLASTQEENNIYKVDIDIANDALQ